MNRGPYSYGLDTTGKRYWRSLGEFADSPEFLEALHREFPEGASELTDGVSRRSFISLMGASLGLAGLAGCRRPLEKIMPYAKAPEQIVPGRPQRYATVAAFGGSAVGLVVESHGGRPTKVEGNPSHPDSLGATNSFLQASVLDLYDVDRSTSPREKGEARDWSAVAAMLKARGDKAIQGGGKGLAILVGEHRSPTLAGLLAQLKQKAPAARLVRWEPISAWACRAGAKLAFGQPLDALVETAAAKVIVALDADLLYSNGRPTRQARGFADGRRLAKADGAVDPTMNRLYVVESGFTITGASADHRLRVPSRELGDFTLALAKELGVAEVAALAPAIADPKRQKFVAALAKDLKANPGRTVVVAGERQPPEVHAVVHLINQTLGNLGQTVTFVPAFDDLPEGPAAIAELVEAMKKGEVETLLLLGGNPAFDAPADLAFAAALEKVALSVHLATHVDETSARSTWHLNQAHYLESWSDARALDGTYAVGQPLIAPLHGGRTDAEVVELLLGGGRKAYDLVRASWSAGKGDLALLERPWRRLLHDGVQPGSAHPAVAVTPNPAAVAAAVKAMAKGERDGYEVVFSPDTKVWDGRFGNNGWLIEAPDPMTKVTWDNVALISAAAARELSLSDGDMIELSVGGRTAQLPAMVMPGQAERSIGVTLGCGRTTVGKVGTGFGWNAYGLRGTKGLGFAAATVRAVGGEKRKLALTQEHHLMEGRPLIRETDLTRFAKQPDFAQKMVAHPPLLNLFKDDHPYESGHKWGMTIDLNTCIGCGSCSVACQAENNIPLVGREGVLRSREMLWIRIDRYFTGEPDGDPEAVMQPVACQHCENAPCEQVCPVGATTHSPEGLNDIAYNRCIGTRYCANNCPYKVRRFNYFNYAKEFPGQNGAFDRPEINELRRMQFNPDVTVRTRGVIEKCTYCVQRITEAKNDAKKEGRDRVRDGEVVTACQQVCPTQAIHFGDLNDKQAAVTAAAWSPRSYQILAELNVRPRTSFLARVRNRNPEIA